MIFFNLKIYTYLCLFYLYRRGSRHADADRKCEEFNNLILHSSFVKMTPKVRKIVSFLFLWQMFSFDTLYSVFPFSFELISRSCWWHSHSIQLATVGGSQFTPSQWSHFSDRWGWEAPSLHSQLSGLLSATSIQLVPSSPENQSSLWGFRSIKLRDVCQSPCSVYCPEGCWQIQGKGFGSC